ncbi:MAG: hypothetical protein A3H42_03055 [Deltaproteobacteria bacterium RIFCSPLOWO2_02_FULL_46_8]|nr:MAG: hypothetical protein A3H42_03055 [Deltaproteobacteria bacterium RIFCSPLOWO2_02_FULL_46_8]
MLLQGRKTGKVVGLKGNYLSFDEKFLFNHLDDYRTFLMNGKGEKLFEIADVMGVLMVAPLKVPML